MKVKKNNAFVENHNNILPFHWKQFFIINIIIRVIFMGIMSEKEKNVIIILIILNNLFAT